MTRNEELAHHLFGQLHDPNRTETDLALILAAMAHLERETWEAAAQEMDTRRANMTLLGYLSDWCREQAKGGRDE